MSHWLAALAQWFGRLAGWALDLVYPPVCAVCGTEPGTWWCPDCRARVEWLDGEGRLRWLALAEDQLALIPVISAARYIEPLARAVHAFKYEAVPHLASAFGAAMAEAWRHTMPAAQPPAVLVPVPMHPRRQRQRGYNHSALLARDVGRRLGLTVDETLLRRVRNTEQQARLADAEARRANVRGAFQAHPRCANAEQIILVDDVFTTGATLRECATALRASGADRIAALTLARARD